MWRWGQRNVRGVAGITKATLGYRCALFLTFPLGPIDQFPRANGDLRRLIVRDGSCSRSGSTDASLPLRLSASRVMLRNTLDSASTPGEQVAATAPEPLTDRPITLDVQTDPPTRGVISSTSPLAPAGSHAASETQYTLPSKISGLSPATSDPGLRLSHTDPCPSTPTPLDELRMLLSLKPTEAALHDLSADRIRSLYHSFRKQEGFGPLWSYEYSQLVSLFGSLSLSNLGRPYRSIYGHHLVEHMQESFEGTYWDMVGLVAKDKRDYGFAPMNPSDCYWLMRMDVEALSTPAIDGQESSV